MKIAGFRNVGKSVGQVRPLSQVSTMMGVNPGMSSPQNAEMNSAYQRTFISLGLTKLPMDPLSLSRVFGIGGPGFRKQP